MFHPSTRSVALSWVFFVVFVFGAALLAAQHAGAQNLPVAAYRVNGTVQDPQGAPQAGAEVLLIRPDGVKADKTETGSDGSYAFNLVAADKYLVSAFHSCCLRTSIALEVGGPNPTVTADPIVLREKTPVDGGDPVVLSGTVKDTASHEGLAGVTLSIYSSYETDGDATSGCDGDVCYVTPSRSQYFTAETDGTGAFLLEVNRGRASLSAYRAGYDTTYGSFAVEADENTVDVPLRLSETNTARLHGILKDEQGNPVRGGVSAGPNYFSCPPEADCMARGEPSPGGYSSDGSWTFTSSQNQYNSTESASDGSWEMNIAAGTLFVRGYAQDHLEDSEVVEADAGDDLGVALVLELVPADSVKVSGRVTDRDTGQGIPFAGVGAENQKWGTWASTQTDEQGRYQLMTKPGYTILTVSAYSYYAMPCAYPASKTAEYQSDEPVSTSEPSPPTQTSGACAAGQREKDYLPAVKSFLGVENTPVSFDVGLRSRPLPASEFKGYVLDASTDKAIEGAVVTFYNELTRDWGSATTDADGSYKIKVHAGYYTIRIWATDHFDGVANADIGDRKSVRLDFELEPGQKRYGYWAYGGYEVAVAGEGGSYGKESSAPEGAPSPSDGQKAYEGSGGGLGPYRAASGADSGSLPGFAPVGLLAAAMGMVGLLRARRKP